MILLRRPIDRENVGKDELEVKMQEIEYTTHGPNPRGREKDKPTGITEFENFLELRSSERHPAIHRFKKPNESESVKAKTNPCLAHGSENAEHKETISAAVGKREMTIRPTADFSTVTISPRRH